MFRKILSCALAALVLTLGVQSTAAAPNGEKQARLAAKVKSGIAQLGTGEAARVELKLTDKTKLKGYISEVSDDHFVVIDKKTGAATNVAYTQVQGVKGNNLSTGAYIAIGVGILAAVLAILLILENTG
ncbi:MAG TPA: hypothetical protein VN643_18740 [Pyrinomonadaceae bacterium]|nr:hypothetical protein [Pyrinomonadaceae bacterium]